MLYVRDCRVVGLRSSARTGKVHLVELACGVKATYVFANEPLVKRYNKSPPKIDSIKRDGL